MKLTAIFAAALSCLLLTAAEARTRGYHPECNITMPCIGAPLPAHLVAPQFARPVDARRSRFHRTELGGPLAPGETARSVLRRPISSGLVAPLAAKVAHIQAVCGSVVSSAVRHTRVAGTRRISLHASGEAVDMRGNPSCIYAQLSGWPGGYSTDYARVRHVHISYSDGGREWGIRFAHRVRHARHRHRVAAVR